MKTEITLNVCNFYSTDCKGIVRTITRNTNIPVTKKEIILIGMKLYQTHYNKFIINEIHNLEYNEFCSHPKHNIYKMQLKNTNNKSKKLNLEKVPKRLIEVLRLNEFAKICSMCRKKTNKDPEYLQAKEYKASIPKKKQIDDNILQVGNYSYVLRNDIFYSGKELKQLELDFQEILEHITIPNEVSLNFKTMLEAADENLIGFFNELYIGTNPHIKSDKTNKNNKKKLVSLCYFLASINNKYINSIKTDIGSYLQSSGASSSSIDTLANIGFSITKKTVDRQKNLISNEHQQTINIYCLQNIEKMFILNIDDYYNIHRYNIPSLSEIHNVFHFVIILVENLNIHDYDGRIQNHRELRSLNNSKLVDFILHLLHNTKDYIECLDILFKVFERLENEYNYLDNYVISVVADWPEQINIKRAITLRINEGDASGILKKILNLIPIIGPLHILLNSRKTLFQTYYFFFKKLYHDLFGEKKVLSSKPKQTVINLILDLTFNSWKKIRNVIMHHFENSKDIEYRMMINLLNNSIPLTLDIYAILFRSGYFEEYLEGVIRIWKSSYFLRNTNQVDNNKYPSFALLTFKINVDIKTLPLAWNTKNKPSNDKVCDTETCLLSNNTNLVILICGHGFHKECLILYNDNCSHCFDYISSEIKKNIVSLTERLNALLKDNEKPLVEKDVNNNANKNDNNENIQDIMENLEQNIDNQFEILY
ncbi:hypothetical protein RclHR1_09030013 [Rhizophagus clarus]|uniref:RING-type domain-containing protein n=1 Tax=Rhizophagus clarus TaxID=94130 RepID=A0A2Z6S594_9GLOM|nr:hypothetical protein RclHR1_09030013 [Rhizophagus clarus]